VAAPRPPIPYALSGLDIGWSWSFIIKQLGDATVLGQMQQLLFVASQSGKWDTSHQSNVLRKLFSQFGLAGLTVSQWRQAAVRISAAHLHTMPAGGFENFDDNTEASNVFDLQRNHSTSVANTHYGFSSGIGVTRTDKANFLKASEMWQDFMEVSSIAFNDILLFAELWRIAAAVCFDVFKAKREAGLQLPCLFRSL
jgi:hypothetical protein